MSGFKRKFHIEKEDKFNKKILTSYNIPNQCVFEEKAVTINVLTIVNEKLMSDDIFKEIMEIMNTGDVIKISDNIINIIYEKLKDNKDEIISALQKYNRIKFDLTKKHLNLFYTWKYDLSNIEPLDICSVRTSTNATCGICKIKNLDLTYEIVLEWGDTKKYEHIPDICPLCFHSLNINHIRNKTDKY